MAIFPSRGAATRCGQRFWPSGSSARRQQKRKLLYAERIRKAERQHQAQERKNRKYLPLRNPIEAAADELRCVLQQSGTEAERWQLWRAVPEAVRAAFMRRMTSGAYKVPRGKA